MACPTKAQLLDAIHGLPGGEPAARHIRECAACRKTYDELVKAAEVFARVPYDETCGHCLSEEQLTRYASRNIHPDMEHEVEEHLSSCPKCLDELVSLAEALESVPEEAPDGLRAKVMALVPRGGGSSATHRTITNRTTRVSSRFSRPKASIGAWALAAAILVVIILVIIAVPWGGGDSAPTAGTRKIEPKKEQQEIPKEEPRKEETVKKEEKKEEPKKEEKKDETVKKEGPKQEEQKKEDPKKEDPVVKEEQPKKEQPKQEDKKKDETVVKKEEPKYLKSLVASVRGELYVKRGSTVERVQGSTEVARGDILQTGHRWSAAFTVGGDYAVSLKAGSQISIELKEEGDVKIALTEGEAFFEVTPRAKPFIVATECADAIVKGTSFGMMVTGPATGGKSTTLYVLEGAVRFKNQKGEVEVGPNRFSVARLGVAPTKPETRTDMAAAVAWTKRGEIAATPNKELYIDNVPGANRKLPGLVIASPYAEWEVESGHVARAVSDRLDAGLVLGHNHRDKKGNKVWMNIDRGTEGKVADNGTVGQAETTNRAMEVFAEYMRNVRAAAGLQNPKGAVPFIVTFRDHSEVVPGTKDELAVCEVAWTGFKPSTIKELKALYDQLLEKYKPQYKLILKFDEVDAQYDFNGHKIKFKFTDSDAKPTGYMAPTNSHKAMTFFFNPSFGRSDEEVYSKIFCEMIEYLYPRQ